MGGGVALPNVSLCEQQNEVHYNPYVDPYNGHAYVDLGLPSGTKWATMNIGAIDESDNGIIYTYTERDEAIETWGGEWKIPTPTQFTELVENTNISFVKVGNIPNQGEYGYCKYTSKTDETIFIQLPYVFYYGSLSRQSVQAHALNDDISSSNYVIFSQWGWDAQFETCPMDSTRKFLIRPVVD